MVHCPCSQAAAFSIPVHGMAVAIYLPVLQRKSLSCQGDLDTAKQQLQPVRAATALDTACQAVLCLWQDACKKHAT